MYNPISPFPYIEGNYAIMPAGLPERFYPKEAERKYYTEHYVICFNGEVSQELKERFIKEYDAYYRENMKKGIF